MRFRNLRKKDPSMITTPPTIKIPLPIVDTIIELAKATVGVQLSPSDNPSSGKQKGKELAVGMLKRLKRKMGEGSSGIVADL